MSINNLLHISRIVLFGLTLLFMPFFATHANHMTGYTCPGTWAPCEDSAGHEDDSNYEVRTEEDCVGDDTTCNPDKKEPGPDDVPAVEYGTIIIPTDYIPANAVIYEEDDLANLIKNLKEGEVIVHVYAEKENQKPRYAVVSKDHVIEYEKYQDIGLRAWSFNYDKFGSQNDLDLVGNISNFLHLSDNAINSTYTDDVAFLQTSGDAYDRYNSLIQYSKAQDITSSDTIQNIYMKTQETIEPDNGSYKTYNWYAETYQTTDYTKISLQESLNCGRGVCRHSALALSTALSSAGYESSLVFDDAHAWVRVITPEKTFDLDPNQYRTYVELPPRTSATNDSQIVPVKPAPKKVNFLQKLLATPAYAETTVQSLKCLQIGVCLSLDENDMIWIDDEKMAEVWADINGVFVSIGFREDADTTRNESIPTTDVNIMGQLVPTHQSVYPLEPGVTAHVLEGIVPASAHVEKRVVMTIISDQDILGNQEAMGILSGGYKLSYKDFVATVLEFVQVHWWKLLLVLIAIVVLLRAIMRKSINTNPVSPV